MISAFFRPKKGYFKGFLHAKRGGNRGEVRHRFYDPSLGFVRYVVSCCSHGSCNFVYMGWELSVCVCVCMCMCMYVQRATGRSFQYFLTKISHKVYFINISNYFFCFSKKVIFHLDPFFLGVLEARYIHEKSMQPRFFVFCSCLPKKLSGDVLAPSDHALDPPGLCTCP